MKLTILSLIFILSSIVLWGQTYFYVSNISIEPVSPTTQDSVKLIISGDLSNTGSYVDTCFFELIDSEIGLTMNCGSNGGFMILVPHAEEINLGLLLAGNYHINLSGIGLGNFVSDTSQFYFKIEEASSIVDNEKSKKSLIIFPNPSYDYITIKINDNNETDEIYILNLESKVYYKKTGLKQKEFEINLSDWSSGVYFVCIRNNQDIIIKKLIIE